MMFLALNLLWGLLATAIIQTIFYHLLDFRCQWFDTLFAAALTCGVSGAAYFCADRMFDAGAKLGAFKLLLATFCLGYGAGLLAFRFMIKSEAGTFLSWVTAGLVTLALATPPVLVMSLILIAT